MTNIRDHISYKEATRRNTATKKGINNDPNEKQLMNMELLAMYIYEPLVDWAGYAIYISSFFRSIMLNFILGGSKTSDHCALEDVAAIDLDGDVLKGKTNKEIFEFIRDHCEFDKLIWEFGDDNNPDWVHASFRKCSNRGIILRAFRTEKGVNYVSLSKPI